MFDKSIYFMKSTTTCTLHARAFVKCLGVHPWTAAFRFVQNNNNKEKKNVYSESSACLFLVVSGILTQQ